MLAARWKIYAAVLAVFAERRQDRNGPYVILRSVTLNLSLPLIRNNNEQSFQIWYQAGESRLPALGTKENYHTLFWSSTGAGGQASIFSLTGPDLMVPLATMTCFTWIRPFR